MKTSIVTAVSALMLSTAPVLAQDFPDAPISMLIGFGAGGTTDTQGRSLAAAMEKELGQPINVINRPGAGGSVAAAQVAAASADGYTILFGGGRAISFNPLTAPVDYGLDDFTFIGAVAVSQPAIVARGDSEFETLEDVFTAAREESLSYATQTTLDRLVMQAFEAEEEIDVDIVPTQGGSGMVPLLLAGDIDFAYSGGIHAQYTESGDMKVIAALTSQRQRAYPDVPTVSELGLDVNMDDYRMVAVPAGTPDDVVTVLQDALEIAAQDPAFVDLTENTLQFPVQYIPGQDLMSELQAQRASYLPLIEAYGEAN